MAKLTDHCFFFFFSCALVVQEITNLHSEKVNIPSFLPPAPVLDGQGCGSASREAGTGLLKLGWAVGHGEPGFICWALTAEMF